MYKIWWKHFFSFGPNGFKLFENPSRIWKMAKEKKKRFSKIKFFLTLKKWQKGGVKNNELISLPVTILYKEFITNQIENLLTGFCLWANILACLEHPRVLIKLLQKKLGPF